MDHIYHKKLMEKLDSIDTKLNWFNSVYTNQYLIINKKFAIDLIICSCAVLFLAASIIHLF